MASRTDDSPLALALTSAALVMWLRPEIETWAGERSQASESLRSLTRSSGTRATSQTHQARLPPINTPNRIRTGDLLRERQALDLTESL